MIIDGMMMWLTEAARTNSIGSGVAFIVARIILGRYTGHRQCKGCQTTKKDYALIREWTGQPSKAAIIEDFEFLAFNKMKYKTDLNFIYQHDRVCTD